MKNRITTRDIARLLITMIMILFGSPMAAGAGVILKLGDILVVEPAGIISVIDPSTGAKTVIAQGGLLSSGFRAVGVAFAPDGDVIVVRRDIGLIRVNPVTESQSILSQGGFFLDPWAIAIDNVTGYIYVADSGYDNDRHPEINKAGKIIRVDPVSGAQVIIAEGSDCPLPPANVPCQNTTSAGSYLAHPYGIAIDYSTVPATLVVADMSSFNGKGAIIRIQAVPNGAQTLVWGPATASPPPRVAQSFPLGCPMGVAVEPNGNILTTVFTFPYFEPPIVPPPADTIYGCAAPGIFRLNLTSTVQTVVNTNAPRWQPGHAYAVGDVIFDEIFDEPGPHVHRVVTAGISQSIPPSWNGAPAGLTNDGSVMWQNIGLGANWRIPFGLAVEPAPIASNPLRYNIVVLDEGHSMVFRLDADGHFLAPIPLSAGVMNAPGLHVITITPPAPPNPPPARFNGRPAGVLSTGTTLTTLGLTTDEAATCRYSTQPGVAYASMTNTFTATGATTHSTVLSGLVNNQSYWIYVRCADAAGNANTNDFVIAFSVGSSSATTSNFGGTEGSLNEGGMWDSPGAWADLQKNDGAFATGLNAQARLVTPAVAADQYAEITYDQDPGSSSWVGVATRINAGDGSGYLAIVYAGEVRLYRNDGLNSTLLASASADIGTAPRRLRLESQGNTHRVYFNGALMISHDATGTIYATGQPGIAASVFGGPQVKILSFEGGSFHAAASNLVGTESPLNEGGLWDSPGPWADLQKNDGAFAIGLNAQARLVRPAVAANQYAEITYDQDPGSSSWVGVATRIHANNGTGYLAIVYVGEVRLYRTDNSAGLKFTLLKSASAATGTAPRKLRLESQGNIHRVYFNSEIMFSHIATGTIYATGQPGLAASVLQAGGPQVKILSFEGGSLGATGDTTPPETTITTVPITVPVGPDKMTNATSATFTFTSEAGSTFQCRLDTAAFVACTSPRTLSGLAAGRHTFEVFATDSSGNADPSAASFSWRIDRTAPSALSITSTPPTTPTNVTTRSFAFTFTDPNAADPTATFQCRLDGAAFAPCPNPVDYPVLANGNHTFRVRAIDPVGNVGPIALHTWTIDTSPPNTTITGKPPAVTTSTSATFTFTASQAGSGFACSLDGAEFTTCTSPKEYTGLAAGIYSFQVRATDPAGNTDPTPAVFGWKIQ